MSKTTATYIFQIVKPTNFETLTKEESVTILQGMAASVEFLFNALDQDGDGELKETELEGWRSQNVSI